MRVLALIGFAFAMAAMPALADDLSDGVIFHDRKDYAKAISSFRKAAERGDASAQAMLGLMYSEGQGVAQDYKEAVSWFQMAAAQGDAGAQLRLGLLYEAGRGVTQNDKRAALHFQNAAAEGLALAQHHLGFMYYTGRGVAQDYIEAHKWLNLARANGDTTARKGRETVEQKMTREQIAEAQRRASEWLKTHK